MLYVQMRSEKNDFIFLQLRPTVEKDDEEPDDEGGQIIIGSKQVPRPLHILLIMHTSCQHA